MFDMLLLLSEGRTVFFGPSSRVVDYFSTIGFTCPPLWNAADWLLDLIASVGRTSCITPRPRGLRRSA